MNKFRAMYIGRAGLFVCTGVACLAINTERKKEAKQLADAAKAAAKKALQEIFPAACSALLLQGRQN